MKLFYFLFALLLIDRDVNGQQLLEWGFGAGPTVYFGDLGNERYVPLSSINEGFTFTLRAPLANRSVSYTHNYPFAVMAQLTWHRISYDETRPLVFNSKSGAELRNFRRGLNFRNNLLGANVQFTYTFYPWFNQPLSHHKIALYLFGGIGIFHSDPRADLFRGDIAMANRYYYWSDGTLRDAARGDPSAEIIERDGRYETHLREWMTEGEVGIHSTGKKRAYGTMHIGFPHGGGIKYGIDRNTTLMIEACFYDFLTDYLDDAHSQYATFAEIQANFPGDPEKQELAKYISDPSGWGSDGVAGPATSPRGNPHKWDWINYFNVQVSFKMNKKVVKSYHAGKKRHSFGSPKI